MVSQDGQYVVEKRIELSSVCLPSTCLSSSKYEQRLMFSSATKTVWISVEYRLAPEHKFPIWLDDGCEVTRQILANKSAYGTDHLLIPTSNFSYRW